MRILTISRQFGSGGRELGKRLAESLGWDYYDKEIIQALAEDQGMDADYIRKRLSNHGWQSIQLSYRNSFSQLLFDPGVHTQLLVRQRELLQEIAKLGNDCVIVGRDADVILQEYHPFRVFVCADMQARIDRCMVHERRRPPELQLTEKEVKRNIRRIDRSRVRTREVLTGKHHGDSSGFDLTVNTTHWEIKRLCPALADFALRWFEEA